MSKYYAFGYHGKRGTVLFKTALCRDDALARIVQKFGLGARLLDS